VAWRIRFTKEADESLRKLDRQVSARILDELEEVSKLDDPRSRGKALVGNMAGLWRYRVGDYRIVCDIEDGVLLILVVDVAHRREVYRRRG
jgi:mRNA interferase RelE/StbE